MATSFPGEQENEAGVIAISLSNEAAISAVIMEVLHEEPLCLERGSFTVRHMHKHWRDSIPLLIFYEPMFSLRTFAPIATAHFHCERYSLGTRVRVCHVIHQVRSPSKTFNKM